MDVIELPKAEIRNGGDVYCLWFTPDGQSLLVLLGDDEGANQLVQWDLAAGKVSGRTDVVSDNEHGIAHPPPAFSPDHSLMTVGTTLKQIGSKRQVRLTGPRSAATITRPEGK